MLCLVRKDIDRSDTMSWRSQQYQQVSYLPTGWREMCSLMACYSKLMYVYIAANVSCQAITTAMHLETRSEKYIS